MTIQLSKRELMVNLYNRIALDIYSGFEGDNKRGALLYLATATLLASPDFPSIVFTASQKVGEQISASYSERK
jgi:hypothetical protein